MRRAFTLVEFVVVTSVICFFLLILMPVGSGGLIRRQAIRNSCQSNLKHIALAFKQYSLDSDGILPASQTNTQNGWADVLRPYVRKRLLFWCPENGSQPSNNTTDYFYNVRLSQFALKDVSVPTATILVGDGDFDAPTNTAISTLPKNWRDDENSPAFRHVGTANYLFVDGHVKSVKTKNIIEKKPKANTNEYSFLP